MLVSTWFAVFSDVGQNKVASSKIVMPGVILVMRFVPMFQIVLSCLRGDSNWAYPYAY